MKLIKFSFYIHISMLRNIFRYFFMKIFRFTNNEILSKVIFTEFFEHYTS